MFFWLPLPTPNLTTFHPLGTTRERHTHRPQWDLPAVRPDGVVRPDWDPALGDVVPAGSDLPLPHRESVRRQTGSAAGERVTEWAGLIQQLAVFSAEVPGLLLLRVLCLRVPAGRCLHLLHPAWDQREDPGGDFCRVQGHRRLWALSLAAEQRGHQAMRDCCCLAIRNSIVVVVWDASLWRILFFSSYFSFIFRLIHDMRKEKCLCAIKKLLKLI